MVERSAAAGYEALVITVDTANLGRRDRDVRRGFALPPRLGLDTILDGIVHPGWTWRFVRSEPILFANVATSKHAGQNYDGSRPIRLAEKVSSQFDPSLSWKDIEWFRSMWNGPIVLKGVQTVEDAQLAVEHGVDAIALSNHGGRQLDSAAGDPRPRQHPWPMPSRAGPRSSATAGFGGGVTSSRRWRSVPTPA